MLIVCVDNYDITQNLLGTPKETNVLKGRTVVQLSTGTPAEARNAEAWFNSRHADYVDGAILAGPEAIGTPDATLVYSGETNAFARCRQLLRSFSREPRYVGEKIGNASALDLAWLSELYGVFLGVSHGMVLCQSEGVDTDDYVSLFAETDVAHWFSGVLNDRAFADPTATLKTWNAALRRIQSQARDREISTEVPDLVANILNRAEKAGLGAEHIAAMAKVLKGNKFSQTNHIDEG